MQGIKLFLCDSLWLLWMVFFRPKSLRREAAQFNHKRRWRLVTQALAVTTAISFVLTTLAGLLLEAVFIPFDLTASLVGVVRGVLVGVLFGVLVSLLGGVARGVLYGVLLGVLFGVLGGVASGVIGGVIGGVLYGMLDNMARNVLFSVLFGVLFGVLYGVSGSTARNVLFSVLYGALGGALFSMLFGILFGATGGVASGAAFLVSYFRLFLLPIEVPTTLWALHRARRQPMRAVQFLRHSLAYWDEVMVLPQPFLTPLLVLVGRQDRDALRRIAAHLTTNTFQRHAAVSALLELSCFDSLPSS